MSGVRGWLIAVLLLAPSVASAQSDESLAKQYYKLGEELYNRADYEGALKQFNQAYVYSQKPALLYNMARCHESLGQHEKAIEIYTEYLSTKPENAEMIEARIANLRKLVERAKAANPPSTPSPPALQPQPESSPATAAVPAAATPAPDSGERPIRRPLKWPGWILVGSGGALLVTGAILGGVAKSKQSSVEKSNKDGREYADVVSDENAGRTMGRAAIATLVVGGVAAATGAVLLILDHRSATRERRAWLAPGVMPGGFAVAGGLRF